MIDIEPDEEGGLPPVAGESAQATFERERAAQAARLRVIAPVINWERAAKRNGTERGHRLEIDLRDQQG